LTRRRNSLLGYGGGLSWSLSPSTSVSADLQVQKNESNLGPSVATSIADVLLGRNSALGSYTKRVITVGLSYSF